MVFIPFLVLYFQSSTHDLHVGEILSPLLKRRGLSANAGAVSEQLGRSI